MNHISRTVLASEKVLKQNIVLGGSMPIVSESDAHMAVSWLMGTMVGAYHIKDSVHWISIM
jgi:hypothetical protein